MSTHDEWLQVIRRVRNHKRRLEDTERLRTMKHREMPKWFNVWSTLREYFDVDAFVLISILTFAFAFFAVMWWPV